ANVVGDVLDVRHRAGTRRYVHARDFEADAVAGLELVRGGQDLDLVLNHLAEPHRRNGVTSQLVEGLPRFRPSLIECPIRCLEPSSRELAFGQAGRNVAFALAGSAY